MEEFLEIRNHIKKLKIKVDIVLKVFLNYLKENKIIEVDFVKIFEEKLRYMVVNITDSHNCFTGHWVKKDTQKTDFENLYKEWNNISPYSYIFNGFNTSIVNNPQKKYFEDILKTCKIEDNKNYVFI